MLNLFVLGIDVKIKAEENTLTVEEHLKLLERFAIYISVAQYLRREFTINQRDFLSVQHPTDFDVNHQRDIEMEKFIIDMVPVN